MKEKETLRFYRDNGTQISTAAKHGLYIELEKYRVDGRSALGQAIAKSKDALASLFPEGPNAAAKALISMIVYKSLRVELYQSQDYATGKAEPKSMGHYINLSNSLRKDLQVLMDMAKRQSPKSDPDLCEYLETVRKAAKAQVIRTEKK